MPQLCRISAKAAHACILRFSPAGFAGRKSGRPRRFRLRHAAIFDQGNLAKILKNKI
jgi:hypothetical protein